MEVRKLIKMGKSSCVVSLPKKWIDSTKLKPGNNVYIDDFSNGGLLLRSENSAPQMRTVTLQLDNKIDFDYLQRILVSKYLTGFERIDIEGKEILSPKLREEISRVSSSLIGLEVVEEGMKRISIECLVKPGELPIDKIIRRMYLLAKDMHKDAVDVLFQRDKILAKTVIERDSTINRLHYLSMRYLNLATTPGASSDIDISAKECLFYQSTTKKLEGVADHAKGIAKYLSRVDQRKLPKNLVENIKKVNLRINELFDTSMRAFFKNDPVMANSVIENSESIRKEL
ncbi:TPA: phosphate uptake regulator PhoU, partial [archaeon]|nr:phosphate uptake regulator PhoU [Candidatus Naiadarchaeales archaeon SRR2090153.bin1042]